MSYRRNELSEKWVVGEVGCRRNGLSEKLVVGEMGCRRSGMSELWVVGEVKFVGEIWIYIASVLIYFVMGI